MPLATMPMISPPKSAPLTRPRPPNRLTPPITAAEIESSSSVPPPAVRSIPLRREARMTPPIAAMPAEGRPAGHVAAEHDEEDKDQSDERHARSRLRLVADVDGSERQTCEEHEPDDNEKQVARWQARSPAAEVGAEGGAREHHCEDDRDDPAGVLRQDVVGDVVDLLVLDSDHALRAENLQDQSLADEQPRERDHE